MTAVTAPSDALRRLLDLLASGASTEQLAHVVVAARAEGALDPADLAALASAGELALRIRETLAEHRRREARLTALFETASELAALSDPDTVLRSIVRRARALLGVDVSYLSLNDEAEGKTYIRVSDGSVSAEFQQIVLGMGEGLGGLVAQTARPYATSDYFNDDRFKHTRPIDSGVEDEGLTAILGVPLAIGPKVLGVLFASDRAAREFSADEVALLSSLADHAAIALDSANLLDQTRRAVAELNEANATMERAEDAHDRLTDLVLRGGDLPDVADAVAAVLHGELTVYDADGTLLASSADPVALDPDALAAARTTGRAVSTKDNWVCAVQAGPELLGSLVLAGRPGLGDPDRRLFERAGVVTALLLMLRRSVVRAEDEVRGELLTDLLTAPGRNPRALLARGRRLGIDLSAPHAVLVAHADGGSRRRVASAAARYATLVGVHAEEVVLLATGDPDELARRVAADLGSATGRPVTVGAAGPASGPAAIAEAHAEAARCVRALLALGRTGEGAAMAGLGFLGQLLGDRADLDVFVRRTLGPVLDYDERRGTELVATLRAYFANGAQLARTKDVLHVHVNTVVQRLERVASLLGEDWQAPDRALEIQLALRLHRLGAPR
ncbi:GAF domain-containing protein [Amycolatopsis mediterranei S699]|uniref:GAF domain-containing protein n=3 Tax=Amycolatopsis mediterranei TaxID=33910 RepID=A0A0H3DCA2_AMYMU|nr:GAF domain-containing protein [Amycolatopsis mediterranei]ADJ47693.1 GAF domain-containing protein [Amycolatopsis mediterranei U32]AEK44580.1 GAF domain-containing protein [Amycolatopsis mediterranei S699]AFO79404.1 GAF domain-containing protein [Amycolatopsis mediterranei S699]AGT86532.1 GAF domain-containing protein [Amycolatopsis mediterranei RB]KDO11873.1 diguanylate phosphodiesterase [Amycolatopsis mediterranei]